MKLVELVGAAVPESDLTKLTAPLRHMLDGMRSFLVPMQTDIRQFLLASGILEGRV